jgi:CDP-diacylglycerol--glycerol-3-phosphate 3-phosphatidyltransferase
VNLPNKLTLTRIALVPFFIACFYMSTPYKNLIAAVVFTLAYLTDVFDGQIARKHNLITNFGKLMDPIADKLLTCSAFIMLVSFGMLSPIAAIIVISREFIISGFRLVAAGSGNVIAASWLGKTKTVSQFVAIDLLLIWPYTGILSFPLDSIVLWISVFFTAWSGADYIVKNRASVNFS